MTTGKTLADTLRDQLQVKGLTLERVRRETGITDRYFIALFEGTVEKLPAAPYVRGYLVKLANVLDLDAEELWQLYQATAHVTSSGPEDRMPENRYALTRTPKSWIVGGVILVLIVGYLAVSIPRLLGRPELSIDTPGTGTITTATSTVAIEGTADPESTVSVNGEHVALSPTGSFHLDYSLEPGLNHIEITATKLLGRAATVVREVVYEPPQVPAGGL